MLFAPADPERDATARPNMATRRTPRLPLGLHSRRSQRIASVPRVLERAPDLTRNEEGSKFMFHSKDGLYFHATGQGKVRIVKTSDGKEPFSRSVSGSDKVETNIVCDVTLAENEWASVMATVSKDGESHDKWMAARVFHGLTLADLNAKSKA